LISIILSTHNQEKFIAECMNSILHQTYQDFELLVLIDGCTDDTLDIVLNYYYNKIKFYTLDDIGLSACRMYGAEKARGEYILFIDGDDKIEPTFLEKTKNLLDQNREIGFIYTDTQHFDGANSYWEQPEYNFFELLFSNYICSCSLIRKDMLFRCGGFDLNNFNYYEDYQFWIRMGQKGFYGKHLPERLFYYRVHKDSGMQSNRNAKLGVVYKAYIISQFPELYPKDFYKQALDILEKYPKNIMQMKPQQQEQWLKENNI
jgi:glycosyltransferase involved in cell wall biosynthesis